MKLNNLALLVVYFNFVDSNQFMSNIKVTGRENSEEVGYLLALSQEELRKIFKTDGAVSVYPN
jgi:hypothetical protein